MVKWKKVKEEENESEWGRERWKELFTRGAEVLQKR